MKKIVNLLWFSLIIVLFFPITSYADDLPFNITADSVTLMDAKTGQILYQKNPDDAYPPASTTKTMTALLTFEKCNLNDVVTIGSNPPKVEGSRIYLIEGEQITVRDLLYGLFLQSGNDCAEALAEHISGSIDNFVKLMNSRAKELGCKDANFENPSGLYNDKHKMSSRDLALIVSELSKHKEFTEIAATPQYTIKPTNKQSKERPLWNENRLINKTDKYYYYDGCLGGKTGYTVQSLFSYTACAERNGETLVVAMVHNKNKTYFGDAKLLLDYGFNNFELKKLYSKGDKIADYKINSKNTIPLIAADDFYYVKKKNENDTPTFEIINKNLSNTTFRKNTAILKAKVSFKGQEIGYINLCSAKDYNIAQNNKKSFLSSNVGNKNAPQISVTLAASLLVIIMRIAFLRKNIKKN